MGYSNNLTDAAVVAYHHTESSRAMRSHSAYTHDIVEGRTVAKTHQALDPKGVQFRESRDSTAHPESLAIAVMFDLTGSMGGTPREVQKRLVNLMRLLTDRKYVDHPQVMIGGIGDATCDSGALQVGQFESGLDSDKDLERIWVEHGGGGQTTESYELAHYFFARHVVTDCWEKRSKKGYLFTLGDEQPYDVVSRHQVRELMGDTLQADVPTAEIVAEVQQKWHVFHLVMDTATSRRPGIVEKWQALLPEGHVVNLRNAENVAEVVGLIVGLNEGRVTDPEADLMQLGTDADSIRAVLAAVTPVAHVRGIRLTA